jgi:hypothetical protein
VDPFGLPITASGALFVPQGVAERMPLLSNQHGTEIYKQFAPSQNIIYSEALFYASAGYVTLMPDYLGLGESPGLHTYCHAKTEATAVVDMLRAVKTFCAENDIPLNSQLFLCGYSQGGHATVAAHREIERHHAGEFSVTASAPMAGPYDLSGTLDFVFTKLDYPFPFYFAFILAAWLPIYDLADTLEELFAAPYDRTLVPRLNGRWTFGDASAAMAPNVQASLRPDFREALLSEPAHPFWRAAADNDLLDWAPRAPMRLYHCSGDEQVPYDNAVLAQRSYTEKGACCVEWIDPGAPQALNHNQCFWPSHLAAKSWFDSLKE